MRSKSLERLGVGNGWAQEGAMAVLGLLLGFAVLPLLIYFAGSTLLGRYDDATPARIYDGVYQGLQLGSPASFVVVFGPTVFIWLIRPFAFGGVPAPGRPKIAIQVLCGADANRQ